MALMGILKTANLRPMATEFNSLSRVALTAIRERVIPGLVVAVGQAGQVRFLGAFGDRQIEPERQPAAAETVYDVASLTKALVASLLVMRGVGDGLLQLDRPLGDHFPMLADRLEVAAEQTLRRTLAHSGGFPAHRKFYEGILDVAGPRHDGRKAIVGLAAAEPAVYAPGSRSIYSDLGFILLGELLEKSMGARLDVLADRLLFKPLQLSSTGFVDLLAGGAQASFHGHDVAPTERCPVRGRLVAGEVHDLNAYAMGGVAGHAGLFANANDLLHLSFALLAAYRGAGIAGAPPIVPPDVLRLFWQPAGIPGSTWRLGWDGPAETGSLAGSLLSRRAVGHLSFTGCSLWIDPEQETCVIVLCNRIHPEVRDDVRFRTLRPALNDAALEAIGYQAR
jgi:CubicO group peptidase (beta-lactamase class C family)